MNDTGSGLGLIFGIILTIALLVAIAWGMGQLGVLQDRRAQRLEAQAELERARAEAEAKLIRAQSQAALERAEIARERSHQAYQQNLPVILLALGGAILAGIVISLAVWDIARTRAQQEALRIPPGPPTILILPPDPGTPRRQYLEQIAQQAQRTGSEIVTLER